MSGGNLTGSIPSSYGTLTALTHLYVPIFSIFSQVFLCSSFTFRRLVGNRLNGTIPSFLANLTAFETLCLVSTYSYFAHAVLFIVNFVRFVGTLRKIKSLELF